MELLILPEQFIIKHSPEWMVILLLSGLLLFFVSKKWRARLRKQHKHSFMPGVLFTVSFIFLIGGINLYVYKIVFNKDGLILFNIKQFNQQIKWTDITRVEYQEQQKIVLFVKKELKEPLNENGQGDKPIVIDLVELDKGSVNKVKILIDLKLKQRRRAH